MRTAESDLTKVRWYMASYALLAVPVMVAYLSGHPGTVPRWLILAAWAASAGMGMLCVIIGSGGLARKSTDGMGGLAFLLHLGLAGVLAALSLSAGAP